jgi:hypothetical protein
VGDKMCKIFNFYAHENMKIGCFSKIAEFVSTFKNDPVCLDYTVENSHSFYNVSYTWYILGYIFVRALVWLPLMATPYFERLLFFDSVIYG